MFLLGASGVFSCDGRTRNGTEGKFSSAEARAIMAERVLVGMSAGAVRESLGRPNDINRTVTGHDVYEHWIYDRHGVYVYIEKGRVTGWQD